MTDDIVKSAAELLIEFSDVESAERAAGARLQAACNVGERRFWEAVRTRLATHEEVRASAVEAMREA